MKLLVILLIILVLGLWAKASLQQRRHAERSWWYPQYDYDEEYSQDDLPNDADLQNAQIDYSNSYQPKYLLTQNEWYAFRKLCEDAYEKGLIICPKVRLFDLVEPKQGIPHYKGAMWKIQSKHVDFVICDKYAHVKAIVELDDSSHNRPDRAERDQFVDQILINCGYKVIRTFQITEETLGGL